MYDDIPVKIENRQLPKDTFKIESNKNSGFSDIVLLSSIVATTLLWIIIVSITR